MSDDYDHFRPFPPKYPSYPPYALHEMYMENYFWDYFNRNQEKFENIDRQYLPVFWTTLYNDGIRTDIQQYLNSLPRDRKYFTIIQHDDGIRANLPKDTLVFAATDRGNGTLVPIPLIASPIPMDNHPKDKNILCSFVGSTTHPIRQNLFDFLSEVEGFQFSHFTKWCPKISEEKMRDFIDITQRSKFALAPRGNIMQSFRIYEILQLGTVPVIVSDSYNLPFCDVVKWNDIAILFTPSGIPLIQGHLESMSNNDYQRLLRKGKETYDKYFTLEGMCDRICEILHHQLI